MLTLQMTLSGGGPMRSKPALLITAVALWPAWAVGDDDLIAELKSLPYRIVHETYRENSWELFMVNADGSNPVNLTRTSGVNEIYPHVSPQGDKISFLVDEGKGEATVRSAYFMNLDGSARQLVGRDIRWSCWNPDGTTIAYLKNEPGPFSYKDGTTKGLFVYDVASGTHRPHPNPDIYHVYNICCSPDGNWFLATVHAGMGYDHTNLAIEGRGTKVFDIGLRGCRPDISPNGKKVAWGESDWLLRVANLNLSGRVPKVSGAVDVVKSSDPMMVYHVDWSPDGKYLAFARGPRRKGMGLAPPYLGASAEGWDICVADATRTNRWVAITNDGRWNKEPDWVPARRDQR
jgi:Tol biopolymer transport system component